MSVSFDKAGAMFDDGERVGAENSGGGRWDGSATVMRSETEG